MAQLDKLIEALVTHSGDLLVLEDGTQPSMTIGSTRKPVIKSSLNAAQIRRLIVEIAPADSKKAVEEGQATSFAYEVAGRLVQVDVAPTGRTEIAIVASSPSLAAPQPAVEVSPSELTMDRLFRAMHAAGASDLHVSSDCVPMVRVDGDLAKMPGMPVLSAEATEQLLFQITPERHRRLCKESGDADFAYEIPGVSRFRCNLFRDRKGVGGVFRVIPTEILTADDLSLSQSIRELCYLSKGLVVVTGPTGSGKSTTLAAMVDLINTMRSDHIITIEDPIEFVHPNKNCLVNQREIHEHTVGFKTALRAALREDPDIVLVGEMRDLETVAIALETAETGHLVFGTLHTTSAVSTVDRIIDQFPADQQDQIRIMLSDTLKAVIAQTLCKKIGGGRVAAMEVMMINAAVSNLIREGKTFQIQSIMQTGKSIGMVLLNDALIDMVKRHVIAPREAYIKAIDKQNLLSAFKAKGIRFEVNERSSKGAAEQRELQPA